MRSMNNLCKNLQIIHLVYASGIELEISHLEFKDS